MQNSSHITWPEFLICISAYNRAAPFNQRKSIPYKRRILHIVYIRRRHCRQCEFRKKSDGILNYFNR